MKNNHNIILQRIAVTALTLAMLLSLAACGQKPAQTQENAGETGGASSDVLQGIYDELLAPDSGYSQTKSSYTEYYPNVKYEEELAEDRFTITVSGDEYSNGSWSFVKEGDYLTTTVSSSDYSGMILVSDVAQAVGAYYGMDPDLVGGYINGLGVLGINNDNFSMTQGGDEVTFKIGIAGAWDMKELDQMVLDESFMDSDPLTTDYISTVGSVGKIRMYGRGSADDFTMLFAEYGDLDDIAYRSIVNMARLRQPVGWEDFVSNYTSLREVETDAYQVTFSVDDEIIIDMFGERESKFSYALVTFGGDEEQESYDDAENLSGSWQDEISQRASMDVSRNDDGSYALTVLWGSGASETAAWEITGSFDENGVLVYDDGAYSVRAYDASGNETVTQETTTQGSFRLEDGKLRWTDSQVRENGYDEDGLFVKID